MFITGQLDHKKDGKELTYYLLEMSGDERNTRMGGGVGITPSTNSRGSSREFAGLFGMYDLLR